MLDPLGNIDKRSILQGLVHPKVEAAGKDIHLQANGSARFDAQVLF